MCCLCVRTLADYRPRLLHDGHIRNGDSRGRIYRTTSSGAIIAAVANRRRRSGIGRSPGPLWERSLCGPPEIRVIILCSHVLFLGQTVAPLRRRFGDCADTISACVHLRLESLLSVLRLMRTWSSIFWMRGGPRSLLRRSPRFESHGRPQAELTLSSASDPELWSGIAPDATPDRRRRLQQGNRGTDGFVMPGTQHDALVWLSGSAYDIVFDMARSVIRALAGLAAGRRVRVGLISTIAI